MPISESAEGGTKQPSQIVLLRSRLCRGGMRPPAAAVFTGIDTASGGPPDHGPPFGFGRRGASERLGSGPIKGIPKPF